MAFTYDSEFIFIGRGDESFLENYSYELSDDADGSGGKIYMSLEILNNQAEAEDIGEAIFANFKQVFYGEMNKEPFERFEAALKAANQTIETLKEEKVSRFVGNLNIALGAIADGTLYLSTTGDAEVYLVRKRFVSIVSEGLAEDSKKETFVNVANGTLEPHDRVVFSSTRLLRYITKGEMGKIFSDASSQIGDALTQLQDFIMTEILGRSAVIGVAVKESVGQEAGAVQEDEPIFTESASRLGGIFKKLTASVGFLRNLNLAQRFSWVKKVGQKAADLLPKKLTSHESTSSFPKIHFHERMSRERILLLVIVLLVVLISGIFWVRTRGSQNRVIAEQQVKMNHARELMNDASTVGAFDKPKASELLVEAEKQAMEVLNSRFLRAEAVRILDDINKLRDSLDDVKRVTEPTLLADLSAKRPNVSALGLLNLKDRLYSFEYNALYEMILDKLQEPLTISDTETIILGASYPDQNSMLFLTRTGKMVEYKDGRFALANTKDGIWKKGVDIKSYNDRLYILDPERNQVWRYPRQRDGFQAGEAYSQTASLDLKNAVSLAIDSSIYILGSDGFITQLYQGQKQNFPLRRSPLSPLTAPTKIYTNPDLNHLFILEPSKQRVVLYRKDPKNGGAQYQTQYVFEKNAVSGVLRDLLVVDNRLYVMDDKHVYFVNLSGL
ncbi:MAG: hypothetical protein AAB588_03455 [Patescibacteria group bacterium]